MLAVKDHSPEIVWKNNPQSQTNVSIDVITSTASIATACTKYLALYCVPYKPLSTSFY